MNRIQTVAHEARPTSLHEVDSVPPDRVDQLLQDLQVVIGRKWYPIILYRLVRSGPLGFNDLKRSIDEISSKVLAESLTDLSELGLVERTVINEKPVRVTYEPTETGQSFEHVLVALIDWGRSHSEFEQRR